MTFGSLSHKSFVEGFDGIDNWLSSKGVPPRSTDRIHQLIKVVRAHNPRVLGSEVTMTKEEQRQYMFALAELLEFHQISMGLRDEDPAILGPKLIRALSGSTDPAQETRKNNDGRNTTFELSLAAEWRRSGLKVEIGEPDIKLAVGDQLFLVECKRPFVWTGLRSCLNHASRQLQQNGACPSPDYLQAIVNPRILTGAGLGSQTISAAGVPRSRRGELRSSSVDLLCVNNGCAGCSLP